MGPLYRSNQHFDCDWVAFDPLRFSGSKRRCLVTANATEGDPEVQFASTVGETESQSSTRDGDNLNCWADRSSFSISSSFLTTAYP
jgi:hypothetical protein